MQNVQKPFLHRLLFIYALVIGIETGAGLFVTKVVFPLWTASPEAVTSWKPDSPFYLEEGDFFMYASPLTFLLSVIVLIVSWKVSDPMRLWVRLSTIGFILIFVISIFYFIPIQAVVKGDAGTKVEPAALSEMLNVFVWTNYLRQIALVFSFGCALHALGLSYRQQVSTGSAVLDATKN